RELPVANALGRIELGPLQRPIDSEIGAAFPCGPRRRDQVASEVPLPIHGAYILENAGNVESDFRGKCCTALCAITRKPMYQIQLNRSKLCPNMPSNSMRNTAVASAPVNWYRNCSSSLSGSAQRRRSAQIRCRKTSTKAPKVKTPMKPS